MAAWLVPLVITASLITGPAWSQASQVAVLQCRVAQGPWQQCRMQLDADGMGWQLEIGAEQIRFRHDQRGSVSMERGSHHWQTVEARWLADASLCWDGICAKGAIPLD